MEQCSSQPLVFLTTKYHCYTIFTPVSYDKPRFENALLHRKLWQKILELLATTLSGLPMSSVKLHILQRFFDSYSAPCLQRKCDVHHHFARFLNQNARFGPKLLPFSSKKNGNSGLVSEGVQSRHYPLLLLSQCCFQVTYPGWKNIQYWLRREKGALRSRIIWHKKGIFKSGFAIWRGVMDSLDLVQKRRNFFLGAFGALCIVVEWHIKKAHFGRTWHGKIKTFAPNKCKGC